VNKPYPRWLFSTLQATSKKLGGGYVLSLAFYLVLRTVFGDGFWWLALFNSFAPLAFVPLPAVLLLAWLLRERWMFMPALFLTLIGGFWFGPYFLPKTPASPSGLTLRVVTFNVWGHNSRLDQVETWLRETKADVVLLQEIPEQYANHTIPELDDLYPYQVSQTTATRWWGNMFLSRHPILSVEDLPGDGVPAQQRFTIDFEGQTLAVYNVHFAMPVGEPRLPQLANHYVLQTILSYDDSARNAEIKRLLARLETEPYPFIVAGDFNMSEHAVMYDEITESMSDAFREAGTGWGGSWPISVVEELPASVPPLLRVDYI